jgi:hypothetical protein
MIPLADAPALRRLAQRTLLVLAVAAAAVTTVVVVTALLARDPHSQTVVALPRGSTAIVALDLSASISSNTFSRIGNTLSEFVHSGGRYGLVVFSDEAYMALPPGTPAVDLEPIVHYFTLPASERHKKKPRFPKNPWNDSFSAGTKISAGLQLAHTIALTKGVHRPVVILISDLQDDLSDVPRLVSVTQAYRRDHIGIRIVGLSPTKKNAALFRKLTAGSELVSTGRLGHGSQPQNSTPFPWTLVALALGAALALAAHELWAPRLEWRT